MELHGRRRTSRPAAAAFCLILATLSSLFLGNEILSAAVSSFPYLMLNCLNERSVIL